MDGLSYLPWTPHSLLLAVVIALPMGAFLAGLVLRSVYWNPVLAIGSLAVSTVLAGFMAITHASVGVSHTRWNWITISDFTLSIGLYADSMTLALLVMVSLISLLVMVYSLVYMKSDVLYDRYWPYLSFFCSSMMGLLVADSLLSLFICWELVGVGSWLLIGFWHTEPGPAQAATQAFLLNRVGDAAFLAGMLLALVSAGTTDIQALIEWSATAPPATLTLISLLLMGGSIAKSAQFPLQIWLPNAMEGPTPVSSLIHAATMVAAGVYLTIRTFPLFTPTSLAILGTIGGVTALLAGLAALVQWDIKRLLAYSTLSQLGLMFLAVGTGRPEAALFHLFTHAVMKCLLFLSAGSIIHQFHSYFGHLEDNHDTLVPESDTNLSLLQDMRIMGGLRKSMPWTFGAYLLAAASMAGIPLTSGFLSKESILTGLFSNEAQPDAIRILWLVLGLGSIVLTTAYLGRQANLVFGGNTRYFRLSGEGIKPVPIPDPSFVMLGPMALLALGTLFPIFSMSPFQVESAWALHLWPTSPVESAAWLPWFSLLLIVTGGGLTYLLCRQEEQIRFYRSGRVYRLLQQHFYQEKIYQKLFFSPFLTFSGAVKWVDERLVDGFFTMGARLLATSRPGWPQLSLVANWAETQVFDGLVRGIFQGIGQLGQAIRKIQSGRVQWYIGLSLTLWVLLLVWIALAIKN